MTIAARLKKLEDLSRPSFCTCGTECLELRDNGDTLSVITIEVCPKCSRNVRRLDFAEIARQADSEIEREPPDFSRWKNLTDEAL